ncbi:response regulator [Propionispora hippei]|uniref:Response regulator receiver domain-containing protein n=1 Tax=Propionispora hippei DSM 15287 TaxID=1123003 RepID=A0A1M6PEC4_9FIRM|nr:response regulator [Propionispora hippei]SHK06264.1 Response regulator receiver domain-containing protein [Propionispora hippei DSM 15287]
MNGEPLVILLVEDNLDHAELILRCFEENRISNRVLHVTDGEAALNYLYGVEQFANRSEHPLPNLILLDLRLPKIDGLQVLLKIKQHERLKHIPVVVLSSSESEKDMIAAYDSYVNSYVIKPLDYERFISLMKELNFYWIGWNKVPY